MGASSDLGKEEERRGGSNGYLNLLFRLHVGRGPQGHSSKLPLGSALERRMAKRRVHDAQSLLSMQNGPEFNRRIRAK